MPATPNNRIFYACQAVAIEPLYADVNGVLQVRGVSEVHGVQTVGVNTSFNLEQVFELGQVEIYENIEGLPEIEVTLEKVLDGYPLVYHLATSGVKDSVSDTSERSSLVARSKERANVILGIFNDSYDNVGGAASAAPIEVFMSGMYVSSISYTLPVDGNCTESVTLVGNSKVWNTPGSKFSSTLADKFEGDVPANLTAGTPYGGVQRRENVDIKNSILPVSIQGVNGSSAGNGWNSAASTPRVHVQTCTISTDLGRDSIQELGRKTPYYRFANFPVEVTCEFEVLSTSGDFVSAYEDGRPEYANTINVGNNSAQERILIRMHDGTMFNLGGKNRLASVNYTGGDAGGGNVTTTYSYSTYNSLYVTQLKDPADADDFEDYKPAITGVIQA
jgi:hypothetical protein